MHSNAPALAAALQELDRRGVERFVQLGDAFNGPVDPAGVMRLLRERPMVHVRGNGERMILAADPRERSASARFARERLSDADLAWMGEWPQVHREVGWVACHATPYSDVAYLLEEVRPDGTVHLRTTADIAARLGDAAGGLVLSAHTHVPREVRVDATTVVLNPGSVGLPAYADSTPWPHRMEVGDPLARCAVAEQGAGGWRLELLALAYDHEAAARAAEAVGWFDWAHSLRTGFCAG